MCPHNRFDVLFYEDGLIVRKCKDCGLVEGKVEWSGWGEALQFENILRQMREYAPKGE